LGAGIALSASRVDVRAAKVTADATRDTGSKLGTALDGVVAALIAGVAAAVQSRIDGALSEVVSSVKGNDGSASRRSIESMDGRPAEPIRAD
jgi:hypothetical protein